jgi:periplasmic protein CpxP/Spy
MKTLLTTLLAAAVFVFAGSALAHGGYDGHDGHGRHHPCGEPGFPIMDRFLHAMHQLDLSDQQKTDIKAVMQGLRKDMKPLMESTRANLEQLRTLVTAKSYDKGAVAAVAKKEGELATQRIVMTSEAMSKALGYLTDQQRAKLEQMRADREKMRTERMQRWKEHWKDKQAPAEAKG